LTKLDIKDYKNWATGLKTAGYATDKKYAEKLIAIIEYFKLDRFDQ
jgi:flagellum-specific peptidoglycan hydrolase FlgJ